MLKNSKAYFDYNILKEFNCGIKLIGSEVKPLKDNRASINQAYCYFKADGLYIKNMNIDEHKCAKNFGHEPTRERKLLLKKKELNDIKEQLNLNKRLTIIPLKVFEKNNYIKIVIGVCEGKKEFEKRNKILSKQIDKETNKLIAKYK